MLSFFNKYVGVAQLVEQWNHKPQVAGSFPAPDTKLIKSQKSVILYHIAVVA